MSWGTIRVEILQQHGNDETVRPQSIGPGLFIDYADDANKCYADENVHARCLHQCSYSAQETDESVHHTLEKYDCSIGLGMQSDSDSVGGRL